jgi:hypothetical protein
VYVPELIFGHLLTSSNYDDKEKKTTGLLSKNLSLPLTKGPRGGRGEAALSRGTG